MANLAGFQRTVAFFAAALFLVVNACVGNAGSSGSPMPGPGVDAGANVEVPPDAQDPEEPDPPPDPQRLDDAFAALEAGAEAAVSTGIPGIGFSVVQGDRILAGGAGVTALGGGVPITGDTPFAVGSISKVITAILALQQVEAGSLSLGSTVAELAPAVPFADPSEAQEVTVEGLLQHTSGVPTYVGWYRDAAPSYTVGGPGSLANSLEEQPMPIRLWSEPGRVHNYSNPAFALLGLLVERSAGGPLFRELGHQRVLGPLGMDASDFGTPPPGATMGHFPDDGGQLAPYALAFGDVRFYEPHASLWASPRDLARLAAAILPGSTFLSDTVRAQLLTPTFDKGEGPGTAMTLGLHAFDHRGHLVVSHTGSVSGFSAFWYLLPEEGFGGAVTVNATLMGSNSGAPEAALRSAIDAYLGLRPSGSRRPPTRPWRSSSATSASTTWPPSARST